MSTENKITDEQLITLLKTGHPEWSAVLYDHYASILYGIIYRTLPNENAAEEALKESLLRIKNNIQHYEPGHGKLFLWMINICRSVALNKKGSIGGQKNTDHASPYHGITATLENDYRVIIELLFIRGYSMSEVADELNLPLGTIKIRSRAALQKINKLIQAGEKSEWTLRNT